MKHPKSYDSSPETRKRMAKVHLKNGKAETMLAKALWQSGYRYRLNYRKLPGSPDIVITKYKLAIFVDGEFWHGHNWEIRKLKLKANREYWIEKIEENIARDRKNDNILEAMRWVPIHFWEKEIKKDLAGCVHAIDELSIQYYIENQIFDFSENEEMCAENEKCIPQTN